MISKGDNFCPTEGDTMTTDRPADGIVERIPVGHQGSRREYPLAVRFNDAGVHIVCEAEIVSIDDQTLHQNSASLMLRNFFGFL